MDRKTIEVAEQIRKVAEETALQNKWKALANELEQRGVMAPRGPKFSATNLAQFCKRFGLFQSKRKSSPVAPTSTSTPEPVPITPKEQAERTSDGASPVIQGKSHVTHRDTPTKRLDDDTVNELLQMLGWWRARKDQPLTTKTPIQERPVFKRGGDTITKTIRIGKELFQDAEKLTKKERALTGGTFSGLVELLLWKHLGSDKKYLAKPDA